jgi:hypothetical protein
MHYGHFRLAFEELDGPAIKLKEIAQKHGILHKVCFLTEGIPQVF